MRDMRPFARSLVAAAAVSLAGCHAPALLPPPPEAAPGCNPVIGDDCLTPFPSAFFEATDPSTKTGVRVALTDALLPVSANGKPASAARWNAKDGFSPSTPFLVYFKSGVDPASFAAAASWKDPSGTVTATSPVQVIEYDTGERLPVFAELDANAHVGDRQALIVRPMARLKPGTRYLVALVGLRDPSGAPIAPAPFKALRDRTPLSQSLAAVTERYDSIFAALRLAGVDLTQLSLAWDVVTASDEQATSHLVAMRDAALPAAAASPSYAIASSTDSPSDPNLLRKVVGTFTVPWFLADKSAPSLLALDENGAPKMSGTSDANFELHIPECALGASTPLPVMIYGHGLFNSANELDQPWLEQLGNQLCMVRVATDWIGLATGDFKIAEQIATDASNLFIITDRLQQAHVNAQVLVQTLRAAIVHDPALQVGGHAVTDASELYYYGVSGGGVQGSTFLALSHDVPRGALDVPGCEWSLMMQRSKDFGLLKPLLDNLYPDPLDELVFLAASQSEWDYTDPATFAPHVVGAPLAGTPAKRVLVQEAIGDAQVPNIATRVLARTLGVPGMALVEPVFGVTEMPPPLDSAYTQWDVHPMPLPPDVDKPASVDNGAHVAIRRLPALNAQLAAFFKPDGEVTNTCGGGTCSFPTPAPPSP
jgi:hypothetical protein